VDRKPAWAETIEAHLATLRAAHATHTEAAQILTQTQRSLADSLLSRVQHLEHALESVRRDAADRLDEARAVRDGVRLLEHAIQQLSTQIASLASTQAGDATSKRETADRAPSTKKGALAHLAVPAHVLLLDKDAKPETGAAIQKKLVEFLALFDFVDDTPSTWKPALGSWWSRIRALLKEPVQPEDITKRLTQIEAALQAKWVLNPLADVRQKEAAAAAQLIDSLQSVNNAMLVVANSIIVKRTVDGRCHRSKVICKARAPRSTRATPKRYLPRRISRHRLSHFPDMRSLARLRCV
jgi:hypothetical protein